VTHGWTDGWAIAYTHYSIYAIVHNKKDANSFPFGELEEITRTLSYYMYEVRHSGPAIQAEIQ